MKTFFEAYPGKRFGEKIVLVGGIGENLGKGVGRQGVDIFLKAVSETSGVSSVMRSHMGLTRELLAFKPLPPDVKAPASESAVRSELRQTGGSPLLAPEIVLLFEQVRGNILPLRLEEMGTDYLIRVLTDLLNRPVYSEKTGVLPSPVSSRLAENFGDRRLETAPYFSDWIEATVSEQGRVILDSGWLGRLTAKSPRSLFILLSSLLKFQDGRKIGEPLIAAAGEKQEILKQLTEALSKKDNGLDWKEKLEAQKILIPRLGEIIEIIPSGELGKYIEAHDYGVATLLSSGDEILAGYPLGAHFTVDPSRVSENDLLTIAFLVPSLLKAAALVRGIKNNPGEQARILEAQIRQILPGASRSKGPGFVIELTQYIEQTLLNQKLIDVSA